jgi:hypothetical protein
MAKWMLFYRMSNDRRTVVTGIELASGTLDLAPLIAKAEELTETSDVQLVPAHRKDVESHLQVNLPIAGMMRHVMCFVAQRTRLEPRYLGSMFLVNMDEGGY